MNTHLRYSLLLLHCLLGILLLNGAVAATDEYANERQHFLEARKALQQNQWPRYQQLADRLQDYPLYLYLRYDALRAHFSRATDADIRAFLEEFGDTPPAERLRHSWLIQLARQHQWTRFLSFYPGSSNSAELQCFYLQATHREPADAAWLDAAVALWRVGKSQPDACDPVFKVLSDSPRMTQALVWERIRLAMDNNALSLASYLSRRLPAGERKWVDLWRKVHHRPSEARTIAALATDSAPAREILAHAVVRLARSDAREAHDWWATLADRYAFDAQTRADVSRRVALSAAYQRLPQAHRWLAEVPDRARDRTLAEWQARSALLQQDWSILLTAIDALPAEAQSESEWRYWRGRAQAYLGDRAAAEQAFEALAGERSYHGFLAADFLDRPYRFAHAPMPVDDADLDRLQRQQPAFVRARELRRADLIYDARREWAYAIRNLDTHGLEAAAALAHRWGWHDRAIITAARSSHQDDLNVRFPVLYEREIAKTAAQLDLDPAWIMGVMRQESAFMVDARSPAGALGLMQLMPATGSQMAKLLKLPAPSRAALLQADANIRLGGNYLRHVLDDLGNKVLATAAYNAGPYRVRSWLPETTVPAELWVDTIPFTETRGYVRGVLAFTTVYDARLERPVTPLHKRMPDIGPKPQ